MVLLLIGLSAVYAQDTEPKHQTWVVHAGQINFFDGGLEDEFINLEYRWEPMTRWNLIPSLGLLWSDHGAKYLYHDLKYQWEINETWSLFLGSGLGYFEDSPLIDLGHHIQFRTGLEVSFAFNPEHHIGLAAYHYSNSRLSSVNPGTESLSLFYAYSPK